MMCIDIDLSLSAVLSLQGIPRHRASNYPVIIKTQQNQVQLTSVQMQTIEGMLYARPRQKSHRRLAQKLSYQVYKLGAR